MKNHLNLWLSCTFIALSVGALGVFIYRDLNKTPTIPTTETQGNVVATTTTTAPKIDLGVVESTGDYKIEIIDSAPKVKPPKLERPIVFPPSFSANTRSVMQRNIDGSIAALKRDAGDINAWLNLAIYRKMLNDYKGAEEIWIYLTKILKEPSYVYANLGDLYGYFLKNPAKAEVYFKDAIHLEPGNIEYHAQFAYFYLDVLKDGAKALALVQDGYLKNKTRPDFRKLLEQIKNRVLEEPPNNSPSL